MIKDYFMIRLPGSPLVFIGVSSLYSNIILVFFMPQKMKSDKLILFTQKESKPSIMHFKRWRKIQTISLKNPLRCQKRKKEKERQSLVIHRWLIEQRSQLFSKRMEPCKTSRKVIVTQKEEIFEWFVLLAWR